MHYGGIGAQSPVTPVRELHVQESHAVINVTPVVRADPRGGFLVADVREAQIRRYDKDGRLLWHVGKRGHGPLEFEMPQVALRLPNGNIFVADTDDKIAILDSVGTRLVRSFLVPIQRIENAAVLNDTLVICSGRVARPTESTFLHIVNLARDSVTANFFRPFDGYPYPDIAATAGSVVLAVRGNEIAAAALPKDTIYFFGMDGNLLRRFRLPSQHFRTPKPIDVADFNNPRKRSEWLASFETITGLYWIGDSTIVVRIRTIHKTTLHWDLLGFKPTGERLFEWLDAPKLIGADGTSGKLVFQSPRSVTPNVWLIARLSPSSR